MPTIVKTPSMKDSYYVDFVNQLGATETLSTVTVTAFIEANGADATADLIATPAPQISGTQVIFWYQAGLPGVQYIIAVKVTTSLNRELEGDVNVVVQDEIYT